MLRSYWAANDLCRFAICFPPCGVCLRTGCSCDLVINILLTLLGFFPGVLHALYVIGAWSGRDSSRCPHDGPIHRTCCCGTPAW